MKTIGRIAGLLAMATALLVPTVSAGQYNVDLDHSAFEFKVKHLGISKVTGTFGEFSGTYDFDPKDVSKTKANITVKTASVDTNHEKRDDHLRNADFFDSENHAEMTFVSTKVTDIDDDEFNLHGNLTIRGVTKPVVFEIEYGGSVLDPWGNMRSAFTAETKIDRTLWGLEWNMALETGGFVVGKEVKITIEIEGIAA